MKARNNGRYNGNGREWETPPEIFDPLDREFSFTLDPCATAASAKCARFYTEAEDGLAQDWTGERVFMNPPYGKEIYAWTKKASKEAVRGALVVGLLPASTDLAWWHDDVVGANAEIRYLRGRVRFLTAGPYRASGFFASVVVIWRPLFVLVPAPGALTALSWRWRRVGGSHVAHLVPARPGRLSRTACNRLPVTSDDVLETPVGLLTEVELCDRCAKADR